MCAACSTDRRADGVCDQAEISSRALTAASGPDRPAASSKYRMLAPRAIQEACQRTEEFKSALRSASIEEEDRLTRRGSMSRLRRSSAYMRHGSSCFCGPVALANLSLDSNIRSKSNVSRDRKLEESNFRPGVGWNVGEILCDCIRVPRWTSWSHLPAEFT